MMSKISLSTSTCQTKFEKSQGVQIAFTELWVNRCMPRLFMKHVFKGQHEMTALSSTPSQVAGRGPSPKPGGLENSLFEYVIMGWVTLGHGRALYKKYYYFLLFLLPSYLYCQINICKAAIGFKIKEACCYHSIVQNRIIRVKYTFF